MIGANVDLFHPAKVFDTLVHDPGSTSSGLYQQYFKVIARPGEVLQTALRPDDIVVTRVLGEGNLADVSKVADLAQPFAVGSTLGRDQLALRLRMYDELQAPPPVVTAAREADVVLKRGDECGCAHPQENLASEGQPEQATDSCRPGEGPPAAEPDPAGRGPHPLLKSGTGTTYSRRPSVGYAQQCLNNFLAQLTSGAHTCPSTLADTQRFITAQLDALRAAGQVPLVVDCRFGPSTERATKAFQACQGIDRDGKIGPVTWPLLERWATSPAPPPVPPGPPAVAVTFNLLLDEDRDGSLDGSPATGGSWVWGAAGRGAIVLVNNDDDAPTGRPDNENNSVEHGNDDRELAPLAIERAGGSPVPPGTQLELLVDNPDNIRLFSGRRAGSREIIGPGKGAVHRFTDLRPSRFDLAMEGVRYARRGFDGEVRLTLRTTDPGGVVTEQHAVVRVAPWLMPSHLDNAETVFVGKLIPSASFGKLADNARFRGDLKRMVTAAGCTLKQNPAPIDDRWMQDCMEFGYSSLPGAGLRTVLRSTQVRPLSTVPRSLLKADFGYAEEPVVPPGNTFDSTGNLEATPPVTSAAGKHYPFGRIYFCPGRPPFDPFNPEVAEFLRKQVVQEPIEIDTTWLAVGHVDEVISFVPAPGPKGFKLLLASPRRAYDILDALNVSHGGSKLLTGRSFVMPTVNVEHTIADFLALPENFHGVLAAGSSPAPTSLRDYNLLRQADMDAIRAKLLPELGLVEDDVIDIPMTFMPNPGSPPFADALTGGMVNMLVLNKHCIVPKPFGPVVAGVDTFEEDVRSTLQPLGLNVEFLDCWDQYHVLQGGVHCATNTLRKPTSARWWEFQP